MLDEYIGDYALVETTKRILVKILVREPFVGGNRLQASRPDETRSDCFGRPSSSQVSPKKDQSRFPRRSKYLDLNQRGFLFGCLLRAHCHRLEKIV